MPNFTKTITYALAAAVTTGIAASQSGTANTPLTLNGSLVTVGVATLDSGGAARRVIVTSAGNDSGITFKIVGTDRYGRPQTEILTGANTAAAQSVKDFLTVTSITPSGNTASTVTSGTNGVGSSAPMIVDWNPNGNLIGCSTLVAGTVNYTIQEAMDDFSPAWDLTQNNPNWFKRHKHRFENGKRQRNVARSFYHDSNSDKLRYGFCSSQVHHAIYWRGDLTLTKGE